VSTKEQLEIIQFTQAEFAKYPEAERRKMYEAVRLIASMVFPHDFSASFTATNRPLPL
jgi:hypothetical protein